MRKVIYSFGISLDGFIAGPDGDFGWSAPDEELHRFHNEQARRSARTSTGGGCTRSCASGTPSRRTRPARSTS